jgi:hypothetical protein
MRNTCHGEEEPWKYFLEGYTDVSSMLVANSTYRYGVLDDAKYTTWSAKLTGKIEILLLRGNRAYWTHIL